MDTGITSLLLWLAAGILLLAYIKRRRKRKASL